VKRRGERDLAEELAPSLRSLLPSVVGMTNFKPS